MKELKMKTPLSIRLIYWMINIGFWLNIAGLIFVIINIFYSTEELFNLIGMRFIYSIDKNMVDISSIIIHGKETPVMINEVSVAVSTQDLSRNFVILNNVAALVSVVISLALFQKLKELLINIKNNIVFGLQNVQLLKSSAYLLFSIWLFSDMLFPKYIEWYIGAKKQYQIIFTDLFFSNYFILAIALLAIAYIFERGVKLQDYKDLTI